MNSETASSSGSKSMKYAINELAISSTSGSATGKFYTKEPLTANNVQVSLSIGSGASREQIGNGIDRGQPARNVETGRNFQPLERSQRESGRSLS